MQETNELNDIILNKGSKNNNNKKIVLAIATLGIVLIIVVMLMNSISSDKIQNLPQAVLPPKPNSKTVSQETKEPLFEKVTVIHEDSQDNSNLNKIAKKLKEESSAITETEEEKPVIKRTVKKVPKSIKKSVRKQKKVTKSNKYYVQKKPKTGTKKYYYIQVGSFSRFSPNKKFLKSITDLGYKYRYYKVTKNSKTINKVLVGPFKTRYKANRAKRVLHRKVIAGAFVVKI